MPKYIYNPDDWAIIKYCHYCGKLFYPEIEIQKHCDTLCELHWKDYKEDMEWFELNGYLNNYEDNEWGWPE